MAVAQSPGPEPAAPAVGLTPVHRIGEQAFEAVAEIGDAARFSVLTIAWLFRKLPRWSVMVPNLYAIGVSSVPVVAITGMSVFGVMRSPRF